MQHFVTRIVVFIGLTVMVTAQAGAFNTGYLRDSPLSFFTEEELQTFIDTLNTALDGGEAGEVLKWGQPDAPRAASGNITIIDTEESGDGSTCRNVRIENRANGRFGGGLYKFCRANDGEWKLAR